MFHKKLRLLAGLVVCACLAANSQAIFSKDSKGIQNSRLDERQVRTPAIGQTWVYQVRNMYNNLIEDEITESVVEITPNIKIERSSKKYGSLQPEIQSAVGMILTDPYWSPAVNFSKPKPMWFFEVGSEPNYTSSYWVDDGSGSYSWTSAFKSLGSETVSVNGETYHSVNSEEAIQFTGSNFSKKANRRTSVIWLVPNIGRWVVRVVNGSYYDTNSGLGGDRYENFLRYELISWK